MFPFFRENFELHYFGNNSIGITNEQQLFFNDAETLFLDKIVGNQSLKKIAELVGRQIASTNYEKIEELILLFLNREDISYFIGISDNPVIHSNLKISGKRGYKFPINILLEITNKCNLKCVHCYKEAGYSKNDDIDFDLILPQLKYLAKHVRSIQITGGEPVSHKQFAQIAEFAKLNFEDSSITTAATLITERNIHLFNGFSNVQVSLYSTNPRLHEQITLIPRSYEKTLNGIRLLRENHIYTTITSIITQDNINEIEELVKKGIELNVNAIKFGEFSRIGRGLKLSNNWNLKPEDSIKINAIIKKLQEKYNDKINIDDWESDDKKEKVDKNHGGFSCGAGDLSWTITEHGNIRPCVFLPEDRFSTGNIITDNLDYLLQKQHNQTLYASLTNWENALNSMELSTENVCPVMSNYLSAFEEYSKSKI